MTTTLKSFTVTVVLDILAQDEDAAEQVAVTRINLDANLRDARVAKVEVTR